MLHSSYGINSNGNFTLSGADTVTLAKKYGLVGLWIITDPSDLERCIELGADIIETDGAVTMEML